MQTEKIDIKSLEYEELQAFFAELSEPSFRAGQVFSWLHEKLADSFGEMTNLPLSLRKSLSEMCDVRRLYPMRVQTSELDGTKKYLFKAYDGNYIESVLMRYKHGNSVCVSTQVGCAMGCRFCASAKGGLVRNLSASEILSQVYEIQKETGERVSNIVIMGMGEPLANYENTVAFIRIVSHEKALHISQRNITMSTCGIVPAIYRLSEESLGITLALSLHAPNDKIRRQIMPVAERFEISEIIEACGYYFRKTGRRVTYEYCLMGGVNDSEACARELAARLKGSSSHVNLIRVNPAPDSPFKETGRENISSFIKILASSGITATLRREMGRDIDGACGQLRRRIICETGERNEIIWHY